MHFLAQALLAVTAAQSALCSPVTSRSAYAVKESHFVPSKWTKIGIPEPDHRIELKIGLKRSKFPELERHLYEVSDPRSKRYGAHLSKEEVEDLTKPTEDASVLVDEWLADNGIKREECEYSSARNWISVRLPVAEVERLLDTTYSTYKHIDGDEMVRTTEWSLPHHLHEHISTIQPTTAFFRTAPKAQTLKEVPGDFTLPSIQVTPKSVLGIEAACNFSAVTPTCLRTLYKTIDYKPQSLDVTEVGFTNYLGEFANRTDVRIFLEQFRPEAVSAADTFEKISVNGTAVDSGPKGAGLEANLDIETLLGIVYPINVTSWNTGGSPPFIPDEHTPTNTNEPYLVWLEYVLSQDTLPQVISTSYGDDEMTVPLSYAQAVCEGFAELGSRGVSVLFSSGDSGVGENSTCFSNDGKNSSMFVPSFPASCPYVTSVGGTYQYPEIVAYDSRNGYASGSGFSNYFATPDYQTDVVEAYVDGLNGEYDGWYNKSGRAYPDLAAQGYRYLTIWNGSVKSLDGTSASCPCMSSIITLVNDALIAAGKPVLGFLNPWLYSGAGEAAFTDVVGGSSIGCDVAGFEAKEGWDVASGWGTPDFEAILKYLEIS